MHTAKYKTAYGVILDMDQALLVQEHYQGVSLNPDVFADGHWSLPAKACLMGAGAEKDLHSLNGIRLEDPEDRLENYVFGIYLEKNDLRDPNPVKLPPEDRQAFEDQIAPALKALGIRPQSAPSCLTVCQIE